MTPPANVLDKTVTNRRIHTIQSAANAAGIGTNTVQRLLQNDPSLIGSGADPKRAGSITDEKFGAVIELVARMMKGTEVMAYLGIVPTQFWRFSEYGIIKKMPGLDKYFDRSSVEELLTRLSAAAVSSPSPPHGTWSLVDAISAKLSIRKAIEFVSAKRLDHIWHVESEVGLKRIWLDEIESRKKLHSSSPS